MRGRGGGGGEGKREEGKEGRGGGEDGREEKGEGLTALSLASGISTPGTEEERGEGLRKDGGGKERG